MSEFICERFEGRPRRLIFKSGNPLQDSKVIYVPRDVTILRHYLSGTVDGVWLLYGDLKTVSKVHECLVTFGVTTYDQVQEYLRGINSMNSTSPLPDSGKREEFTTGAVRDVNTGKGRFDLLSPIAMLRKAKHYENGALKYADRNWEKGIPNHRFIDSALRHIFCYLSGDRSEDHLAAAGWNIDGIIHTNEKIKDGSLPATLNTLPFKPEDL